jgi:hypothetical protein
VQWVSGFNRLITDNNYLFYECAALFYREKNLVHTYDKQKFTLGFNPNLVKINNSGFLTVTYVLIKLR